VATINELASSVPKPVQLQAAFRDEKEEEPVFDSEEEDVKKWQDKQVKNWHLAPSALGKKAFYPSGPRKRTKVADQDVEFIPLGQEDDEMTELDESAYRPLRVKRVKPKMDRMTKKKNALKTKK